MDFFAPRVGENFELLLEQQTIVSEIFETRKNTKRSIQKINEIVKVQIQERFISYELTEPTRARKVFYSKLIKPFICVFYKQTSSG